MYTRLFHLSHSVCNTHDTANQERNPVPDPVPKSTHRSGASAPTLGVPEGKAGWGRTRSGERRDHRDT